MPQYACDYWSGKDHQPTEAELRQQEKAAGMSVSPAQEKRRTDEVEALEKQILRGARQGPGAAPP